MSSKSALWGGIAATSLVALVGCAVGSGVDDVQEGRLATVPIEAGSEDDPDSVLLEAPSTKPQADAGAPSDAASPTSPDASTVDAGGLGGGGGTGACASPNACAGAVDLGSVSGDTGADFKTVQGTTSQWFKVRVTENDSEVLAMSLQMKAMLTSPPGTNFDLHVYVASSESALECTYVTQSSTSTGASDQASVSFGEGGAFSNGSVDDRWVTVEVRHVSGTCSPTAKWTLSVSGNQS